MICPNDDTQMIQHQENGFPIGGGYHDDIEYTTWMVLICQECGLKVKESYSAEKINEQDRQIQL